MLGFILTKVELRIRSQTLQCDTRRWPGKCRFDSRSHVTSCLPLSQRRRQSVLWKMDTCTSCDGMRTGLYISSVSCHNHCTGERLSLPSKTKDGSNDPAILPDAQNPLNLKSYSFPHMHSRRDLRTGHTETYSNQVDKIFAASI